MELVCGIEEDSCNMELVCGFSHNHTTCFFCISPLLAGVATSHTHTESNYYDLLGGRCILQSICINGPSIVTSLMAPL